MATNRFVDVGRLRVVGGEGLGLLASKRVGQGLLRCVSRNEVGLDVNVVLLGLANVGAPRSNLLIVRLAHDKDNSASNDEDPTNPSEDDRGNDTCTVSVVERSLSVLHNQSVALVCAHTSNVGASRGDNDSHGNTTSKVDEDTGNGRKFPGNSDTMVLVSLRPDQVEEESATEDGSDVDSGEDVVGRDTNIVVVVLVSASAAVRLNPLLLADES